MKTGKIVVSLIFALLIVFSTVYITYAVDDEANIQTYAAEEQDQEMSQEEMDKDSDVVVDEQQQDEEQQQDQEQETEGK